MRLTPLLFLAATTAFMPPVHAEVSGNLAAVAFVAENDFRWSDKYYTNGLGLAYTTPEVFTGATGGVPRFFQDLVALTPLSGAQNAGHRLHFALAHEIYTAKNEYSPAYHRDDHPYAGLFHATLGISSETPRRMDTLEMSLGIIGPSAQGRRVQNQWHRLVGDPLVRGWGAQLRDEPVIQLAWERTWRIGWELGGTLRTDLLPRVGLEAGTVRDVASLGVQWRAGWNVPGDFGLRTLRAPAGAALRPARSEGLHGAAPDAFYFFIDAQGEAWAWNAMLDGNAWRAGGGRVRSYPFVAQVAAGFAAHWGGWRLGFAQVVRSKEFATQDDWVFVHSSISLGLVF
ncbi:MAG: lipid A deacylase LpxR family protein [Puniceicoccales bacterium]|jgi:hypothetical protein|nr:lipid A deacylase LpxR family protein [Puniceicoccales bacterium]